MASISSSSRNICPNNALVGWGWEGGGTESKLQWMTTSFQQQQLLTERHRSPGEENPAPYWCNCKLQQPLWKGWRPLKLKQLPCDPNEAQTYEEIYFHAYDTLSTAVSLTWLCSRTWVIIFLSLTCWGWRCVHHFQLSFTHFKLSCLLLLLLCRNFFYILNFDLYHI